ncbi:basic salivary proline-rich protein 4-like [Equus caballus]|uniref:basic salivary proline-rich protein 4-like n=1 Tax=Equus caballus TaxID=9796 RepID=UPI0038B2C3CE
MDTEVNPGIEENSDTEKHINLPPAALKRPNQQGCFTAPSAYLGGAPRPGNNPTQTEGRCGEGRDPPARAREGADRCVSGPCAQAGPAGVQSRRASGRHGPQPEGPPAACADADRWRPELCPRRSARTGHPSGRRRRPPGSGRSDVGGPRRQPEGQTGSGLGAWAAPVPPATRPSSTSPPASARTAAALTPLQPHRLPQRRHLLPLPADPQEMTTEGRGGGVGPAGIARKRAGPRGLEGPGGRALQVGLVLLVPLSCAVDVPGLLRLNRAPFLTFAPCLGVQPSSHSVGTLGSTWESLDSCPSLTINGSMSPDSALTLFRLQFPHLCDEGPHLRGPFHSSTLGFCDKQNLNRSPHWSKSRGLLRDPEELKQSNWQSSWTQREVRNS